MQLETDIARALWTAANAHGHTGLELEFRLGHALPGGFSSNVGRDNFHTLKQRLDKSARVFGRIIDVETVEIIGGGNMKHVTTLAFADPDPKPCPPPFCLTKRRLFFTEFDKAHLTARCSISLEVPVPLRVINSRLTRHKRRRRYIYKCWAFDLTEVVSTADVDSEETFEVEIELLDTGMLFERTMASLAEWGLALVNDISTMLTSANK